MPDRPVPRSVTDELLVHIHDVLGEIRDRLPAPQDDQPAGTTAVSEPGKPGAAKAAPKRARGASS